jgi:hypothetical protein
MTQAPVMRAAAKLDLGNQRRLGEDQVLSLKRDRRLLRLQCVEQAQ